MTLRLANIISRETSARLRIELPTGDFSTGPREQDRARGPAAGAGQLLVDSLLADPLFRLATQPRALSPPRLFHHNAGADAAATFDDAIYDPGGSSRMDPAGGPLRVDVTVSVFLNDPSDYDGGELVIDAGDGDEVFKESLGTCLIYPADAPRRIERVSRGDRWTAQLHVQSLIRGPAERQILYDIGCASYFLETFGQNDTPDAVSLRRCREQLLRLWAET